MQIFFIVGAQKSGTTWLQRLLNDVPGVACFGESHFADRLLLPVSEIFREYNNMMALVAERVYEGAGHYGPVSDPEFLTFMRTCLRTILQRTAGDHWADLLAIGDKTPAHSFHIPQLKAIAPNAKFVHMLRDGRDVVVSAYHHRARILGKISPDQAPQPLAVEAPSHFLKWSQFTKAVLSQQAQGVPIHTVRYEALRAAPLQELRRTLTFLLPDHSFSAASLEDVVARNDFSQRSGGRRAGEVNDQAFLRQGLSGSWQRELRESQVQQWDRDGLALLDSLGYNP